MKSVIGISQKKDAIAAFDEATAKINSATAIIFFTKIYSAGKPTVLTVG